MTIKVDDQSLIVIQICSLKDDQGNVQEKDREGVVHRRRNIFSGYWCSCLCYCNIFCLSVPTGFIIVGSIYIYYGYSVGSGDSYCLTQPLMPVLLVVCGILVLLHMISTPWQFDQYTDARKYILLLLNVIIPIFFVIFTFMIL